MDLREIGRVYLPIGWLFNDVVHKIVNPARADPIFVCGDE